MKVSPAMGWGWAALALAFLAAPGRALAYVDPGTTSVVFSGLGYVLALGGAALLFLARPFIRLWRRIQAALAGRRGGNRPEDHADPT